MKNLLKKLSNVRKATGFIKKENVGSNLKYKAVSADMALSEVRPLIDKEDLFLSTQIISEKLQIENKPNDYGKTTTNFITSLELIYTWYDVESGESLDIPWKCTAQNTDPAKSNGSALTYAEKYFLLKYFNIISSENIKLDPDAYSDTENTKQQDINKKPIPETNQNFNYKPSDTVNWINTKTKKPVPEKAIYNAITKAFLGIYENENLNKENKVINVLEVVQTYIETFEGLTLKESVLKVPYQIILKDIEKL